MTGNSSLLTGDQDIGGRSAFNGVPGAYSSHDLSESYGRGAIRLSTHPALVRYDKGKPSKPQNEKIRRLAVRLA